MRSSQVLTDMYSFSHSKHLPLIDRNVCVCLFSEEGQRNEASIRDFPCSRHLDSLRRGKYRGRWILRLWTQMFRPGQMDSQSPFLKREAGVPRIEGQQRRPSTVLPWGPAYEPPRLGNLHIENMLSKKLNLVLFLPVPKHTRGLPSCRSDPAIISKQLKLLKIFKVSPREGRHKCRGSHCWSAGNLSWNYSLWFWKRSRHCNQEVPTLCSRGHGRWTSVTCSPSKVSYNMNRELLESWDQCFFSSSIVYLSAMTVISSPEALIVQLYRGRSAACTNLADTKIYISLKRECN